MNQITSSHFILKRYSISKSKKHISPKWEENVILIFSYMHSHYIAGSFDAQKVDLPPPRPFAKNSTMLISVCYIALRKTVYTAACHNTRHRTLGPYHKRVDVIGSNKPLKAPLRDSRLSLTREYVRSRSIYFALPWHSLSRLCNT